MSDTPAKPQSMLQALLLPAVWRKAAPIGFAVGLLQAAVNQGDHWLTRDFSQSVVLKSILSPLIGLTLAIVSAAASHLGKIKVSSNT